MWSTDHPYYSQETAKKIHNSLLDHIKRYLIVKGEAINEEMDKRMEGADETQELTHILT